MTGTRIARIAVALMSTRAAARVAQPDTAARAAGRTFFTSGTIFAWHKLPLRIYLLAIVIVCNEVKGKSMLALRRDLRVQYKTAFVLSHKLREAMASEVSQTQVGGVGKTVQVDGVYVGKYVRPKNIREERIDRRLSENRSGHEMVVVALREKGGARSVEYSNRNPTQSRLSVRMSPLAPSFMPTKARRGISFMHGMK